MIETIKNKFNADEQRENGVKVYPTEEVLGSIKKTKDFASFYSTHKEDIAQITAHFLLDYCNSMQFTPEELKAFRLGLACFEGFFDSCESDTKSYIMQAENENNRKSVG